MENLPNEVLLHILSFLRCKHLLHCRLTSKKWNLLAIEILKKNCPLITISSRMEAIYFLQLSKSITSKSVFPRIRLAVNKIPIEVLTELGQEFSQNEIELTLFRKFEKSKSDLYKKVQALLRNLEGVSYLKIESSAKLWKEINLPVEVNSFKFPSFYNLTKIVWSEADKNFLLVILQKAPALRCLEVTHWYDDVVTVSLGDAPLVMKHLPSNALLTTSIPSYRTQTPQKVGYISRMCQFQNKISDLTLHPLQLGSAMLILPMDAWKAAITQLLESQSMSLIKLEIQCEQIFAIPRLQMLKFLKINELPEFGCNPSCFPNLKNLALRADLSNSAEFGDKVWHTVQTLELLWDDEAVAVKEGFLRKIEPSFPNLKLLRIHLRQFRELIKFCKNHGVPAESLCIYARKNECIVNEMVLGWRVGSSMLSDNYPSSRNQKAGSKLGLLGFSKMEIHVDKGILEFLQLVSICGIIKLNILELFLIGSTGIENYKNILSQYHNIVVVNYSNDKSEEY